MTDAVRLHPEDREAIAVRTAQLVLDAIRCDHESDERQKGPQRDEGFTATPVDIARRHGVSADWVRANATGLGGVRLGTGPKPRHRFNHEITDKRIGEMRSDAERIASKPPAPERKRRRLKAAQSSAQLLPIKGRRPT